MVEKLNKKVNYQKYRKQLKSLAKKLTIKNLKVSKRKNAMQSFTI